MKVSEAVESRRSTRAFLDKAVQNSTIERLLEKSSRSASGGNLQPWKVSVINNEIMGKFLDFQKNWSEPETPEYDIYPKGLKEPYRTSRFNVGMEMYSLLGIGRDDHEARTQQMLENFVFFGAPAAFFCFIDKQMGRPQWSDLGMFLQTFMLLAEEEGLSTCAQEAWSMKPQSVKEFCQIDEDLILFCGMSIGHKDVDAKINQLKTDRRPLKEWVDFI
ncbi:MAG: nitroreductase [Gammaproteobacteria bacterium]